MCRHGPEWGSRPTPPGQLEQRGDPELCPVGVVGCVQHKGGEVNKPFLGHKCPGSESGPWDARSQHPHTRLRVSVPSAAAPVSARSREFLQSWCCCRDLQGCVG